MEEIAQADSDAVIEIIGRRTGEVERRHLAVVSVAALYAGAGLPLEARRSCSDTLRRQWAPRGRSLGSMLGASERAERAALAEKVAELGSEDAGPGVAALRARSARLALPMARLRGLSDEEALERPVVDVMCSLAHMAVNRLMRRGSGNFDEVRIHDALTRLYDGQIARERPRSRAI
jgi:thiopeptide-type bacteriocin biosynthesis protein